MCASLALCRREGTITEIEWKRKEEYEEICQCLNALWREQMLNFCCCCCCRYRIELDDFSDAYKGIPEHDIGDWILEFLWKTHQCAALACPKQYRLIDRSASAPKHIRIRFFLGICFDIKSFECIATHSPILFADNCVPDLIRLFNKLNLNGIQKEHAHFHHEEPDFSIFETSQQSINTVWFYFFSFASL